MGTGGGVMQNPIFLFVVLMIFCTALLPLKAGTRHTTFTQWSVQGEKIAVSDGHNLAIYNSSFNVEHRIILFSSDIEVQDFDLIWSPNQDNIAIHIRGQQSNGTPISTVQIWNLARGQKIGEINDVIPVERYNRNVAWLPDNKHLSILASTSNTWSHRSDIYASNGSFIETWPYEEGNIYQPTWSPDGNFFVASTQSHLDLWDASSKTYLRSFAPYPNFERPIRFNPSSTKIAFASYNDPGLIHIWALNPLVPSIDLQTGETGSFLQQWIDDDHLWSVDYYGDLRMWDIDSNEPIFTKGLNIDIEALQDINQNATKALYTQDDKIIVFDIATENKLALLSPSGEVTLLDG